MFVAKTIQADHKDLIHDVAYDFYGRRLASCSSDQTVKVWDLGDDNIWRCTASWKTHSGSVWKVTWAHPEFGQILATCSYDRTAAVWEELGPEGSSGEKGQSQWIKKTSLVDSRTPVTDVKFAPKFLGLQLATCSADGVVRIYEAPDVMNLSQWSLQHEISCKMSCSCISWNLSRNQPPMIAVGSDDPSPSTGKVVLYEYNENSRRWLRAETIPVTDPVKDLAFAPNLGRSFNLLAVASKDVQIMVLKPMHDQNVNLQEGLPKYEIRQAAQFDSHNSQAWRVSWNVTGTILASSGDDGCVKLWKANYLHKWKNIGTLRGDGAMETAEKHTGQGSVSGIEPTSSVSTQRYYKLSQVVNQPKHSPWH